ncbi:MAG: hypothetical protein Q9228_001400 [Teloschistes exilis]
MGKSVGGGVPERLDTFTLTSKDHLSQPYISIWRGSVRNFPAGKPKYFSFQLYVNAPLDRTDKADSLQTFAEEVFAKLVEDLKHDYEDWRLDAHQMLAGAGVKECVRHYIALKDFRGAAVAEGMHTVPSYYGNTSWGTMYHNVLFILDGEDFRRNGEKGAAKVRCVQFGKEGIVEEKDEEARGLEVMVEGMRARDTERVLQGLGQWWQGIWGCADVRQEYDALIARTEDYVKKGPPGGAL